MRFRRAVLAALLVLWAPALSFAGSGYLKLGLTFDPSDGGVGDRWFGSFGSDYNLSESLSWGLEIQSAYRSASAEDVSISTIPVNVFFNGKYKLPGESIRPYAGFGAGFVSAFVRTKVAGETTSSHVRETGVQLMIGADLGERWVFELLGQKIVADGARFSWSVLGGIRW